MPARCSRWRCGWRRWSRRCRSSPATCMASTRIEHQPAKVMAMEGHYRKPSRRRAALLFGLPNDQRAAARLCGRHPQAWQPAPQARSQCAAGRARHHPRRRAAAGGDHLLVVPDHGRARAADARPRACGAWSRAGAGGSTTGRRCIGRAGHGSVGLRRGDRRLGDHRGRAAALHRLRAAAHRRQRQPAGRAGRGGLADRLRHRLFRGVRHRHLVHSEADGQAAASAASRSRRSADPQRRHRSGGRITPRSGAGRRSDGDEPRNGPHHRLGVHHRLRGVHVCGDGRVRPRHRHPVPVVQAGRGARARR